MQEPAQYYSSLGLLEVRLLYKAGMGDDGNMQYCYVTQDGVQSPTLMVWPGDHVRLTLTNMVEVPQYAAADAAFINANYGTNLHFHGMFVSPAPGQDFAVTLVAPGATEFWRVINAGADTILDLQVGLGGMGHATGCDIGSRGCSRPFHSYA